MTDIKLELNQLPNPLQKIILSYVDQYISRLEWLESKIYETKDFDYNTLRIFKQLGMRLDSPSHVALHLSEIYCRLSNKSLPCKLVEKRKPQKVPCHSCGYMIYPERSLVYGCVAYCGCTEYVKGGGGERYHKDSNKYVPGSDSIPTYFKSIPTKAFRILSRKNKNILLSTARELYYYVKELYKDKWKHIRIRTI